MKALLLDADGVVLQKGEYFSEKLSREYNTPIENIIPFFKGPYGECQAGEKDLKQEVIPYLEEWGWQGDVDEFLEYWFEDIVINPEIERQIMNFRNKGIACYLASNNEHYRARRIEAVLGDKLDGYFFSADLKVIKDNPDYFKIILERLNLLASEVGFTDNEEKNITAAREKGINAKLFNEGVVAELFDESINQIEFKLKTQ